MSDTNKRVLRDMSTPEGREIWAAVDQAASRAPRAIRDRFNEIVMIKDPYQRFVAESWEIEGETLYDNALAYFAGAHQSFVERGTPTVKSLSDIAFNIAGGRLRDKAGMDATIGGRPIGAIGQPSVALALDGIARMVIDHEASSFECHRAFERLHPFTDGNGRVGRLLWLWHMNKIGDDSWKGRAKPFLHTWYYQSLEQ